MLPTEKVVSEFYYSYQLPSLIALPRHDAIYPKPTQEIKRQSTMFRENRHTTRATNVRNLYLVAHYIENYNKLINKNLYLVPPIISMC
jgi:hypothetical protein